MQTTVNRALSESADAVWARIGSWTDPSWLPGVTVLRATADQRVLRVPPDVTLTETLLASDEQSLTWTTADHPFPLRNYAVTLFVTADESETCTVCMAASYEPSGASEAALHAMLTGMLTDMLKAI